MKKSEKTTLAVGTVAALGIVVAGFYLAKGASGPTIKFSPNPVPSSYVGGVVLTVKGFQPNEVITLTISDKNGKVFKEQSVDVDETGGLEGAIPVGELRIVGRMADVWILVFTATGEFGTATTTLVIEQVKTFKSVHS